MRYSILILLLFIGCDKDVVEPNELTITGYWKATYKTSGNTVYILEWNLRQSGEVIECIENYYIKVGEFRNSWHYVSGTIKDDSVIMVFNSVQPEDYNYLLNFHYFNGRLYGDNMILEERSIEDWFRGERLFIRQ